MEEKDIQEVARIVANELRKTIEPVMVTMIALDLQRHARTVIEEPLSLKQAVSMAMRFIRKTRTQIYSRTPDTE